MLKYFTTGYFLRGWYLIVLLIILSKPDILGQVPDLNQKITIAQTKGSLEKLLELISQKTSIRFSYSADLVPVKQIITYACDDKPLGEVLNDIFRSSGIKYAVVSGYIVLSLADKNSDTGMPIRQLTFTISGTIVDSSGNEFMIGAVVYSKETGTGVVTNNYGFYSLTLPMGIHTLQTSYLGYRTKMITIDLKNNFSWNVRLAQSPYSLKEIVINSINKEAYVFNSLAAQTNVDPAVVKRQPAALGETDMLKSLDNLPGISFQSDGSSYFSVRGGTHDQNLILLDEATIFNPSHLLGLFTPVIPEAIKHTEIYRADFPVQYGGRISSVIDIRARDGNMQKFSGSASVSPVSTRFSVEGPFKKNASSYFVSYRISTFGLLIKAANPNIDRFSFTDFTSKFNFRLGPRDRLYLTLFAGKDVFINKPASIRTGLEWGNTAATLRWSHIYGSRLFSNTTLYASKYDYSLYTDYDNKLYWNSDITNTNLKSEFTWYLNPRNNLRFGFNLGAYFFNPGNYNSPNASLDTLRVSQVNSREFVFYAGDELELAKWLQLNYGLRYSNWSDYGEAFSVVYDRNYIPVSKEKYADGVRYYSKDYLEPRISISVKTGKYTSLKASYSRTVQHINQINNSISPLNSLEVYLPSGPNIKPQWADCFDVGFVKSWPEGGFDLTSDIYYKDMHNQVGYSNHSEMFLNPYLEGEIRQGPGYAYGFEILLKKSTGRLTGQIGYAYTRSYLHTGIFSNNSWYPSHQDKPIDISFALDYRVRPRWTLTLNTVYTSGMTLTTPTGFYYYHGSQVPYYTKQNNDRLPDYKRLDIGSVWRLNRPEKKFEHYFAITVFNFFNTRNYAFLNFNKIQGPDDKYYVPADKMNMQFHISTYRYVYSVIPSFNYSLKF